MTRHISTKKLPTLSGPYLRARMIAARAQKPIDAEKKKFAIITKI